MVGLLLVISCGLLQSLVAATESNVPLQLRNCTMTRLEDARMLASSIESLPDIKTEEECAAKCSEHPMCDGASFDYKAKKCTIHPRRAFRWGYMTQENDGKKVMYRKECPLIRDLNRKPHWQQILCPLEQKTQAKPSMMNAYRVLRYQKNLAEGSYSCRTDDLCAGFTTSVNEYGKIEFMFYYDVTPGDGPQATDTTVTVKNCESDNECEFLTAYFHKSFTGGNSRTSTELRKNGDCSKACEDDKECYAATLTAFFGDYACTLYRYPVPGPGQTAIRLQQYPGRGRAFSWVKKETCQS